MRYTLKNPGYDIDMNEFAKVLETLKRMEAPLRRVLEVLEVPMGSIRLDWEIEVFTAREMPNADYLVYKGLVVTVAGMPWLKADVERNEACDFKGLVYHLAARWADLQETLYRKECPRIHFRDVPVWLASHGITCEE